MGVIMVVLADVIGPWLLAQSVKTFSRDSGGLTSQAAGARVVLECPAEPKCSEMQ